LGKIFEALNKNGMADEILRDLGPVADAPHVSGNLTLPPVPETVIHPTVSEGSADEAGGPYRIVSLQVSGVSPVLPFEDACRASEQYRMLRTKIIQHPRYPRTIVVSSPLPRDGKSITAVNLAGALSLKGDARVLLVDGDFRHPAIWRQLGLDETPGLGEVLEGRASLEDAIVQAREYPKLFILPAGKPDLNPTELLDSTTFNTIIGQLKQAFKYLIIDSPPIASVADYDLLAAICDGVILVVRPDHTNRQACKKALDSIPKEKCLGVVMNCVQEWFLNKSHGYDGYY
jgi:capsular exopolysaccharide synthesis family protein